MSNTPAPPEDQEELRRTALDEVRKETKLMRSCLETPGKLMNALKCWYVNGAIPVLFPYFIDKRPRVHV
jgi:hypothetical protein